MAAYRIYHSIASLCIYIDGTAVVNCEGVNGSDGRDAATSLLLVKSMHF